jgi:hypothetical protein
LRPNANDFAVHYIKPLSLLCQYGLCHRAHPVRVVPVGRVILLILLVDRLRPRFVTNLNLTKVGLRSC